MKRKISIVIVSTLLFIVGFNSLAIAARKQLTDSTILLDRRPPDCRYDPCG